MQGFARCSFSILCEVLPLNMSLTLMIADLLANLVLTEDLQSFGSLLFKGSILNLVVLQVCEVLILQDWVLISSPRVSNN